MQHNDPTSRSHRTGPNLCNGVTARNGREPLRADTPVRTSLNGHVFVFLFFFLPSHPARFLPVRFLIHISYRPKSGTDNARGRGFDFGYLYWINRHRRITLYIICASLCVSVCVCLRAVIPLNESPTVVIAFTRHRDGGKPRDITMFHTVSQTLRYFCAPDILKRICTVSIVYSMYSMYRIPHALTTCFLPQHYSQHKPIHANTPRAYKFCLTCFFSDYLDCEP